MSEAVVTASMGARKEPPWAPPPLLPISPNSCSSSLQKRFSRFRSFRAGVVASQSALTNTQGTPHCEKSVLVESRSSRAFEDEGVLVLKKEPIAESVPAGSSDLSMPDAQRCNFEVRAGILDALPSEATPRNVDGPATDLVPSVTPHPCGNSIEILNDHVNTRVDGVSVSEGSIRILGAAEIPGNADEGQLVEHSAAEGVTENKVDMEEGLAEANKADMEEGQLPCESEKATKADDDDMEEGQLPCELEEANKADDDDMEEGQLPCELRDASKAEYNDMEPCELKDANKEECDDMEEGQLPCESEEASAAERPSESKVSLNPFDLVSAAIFESPVREPEFTLADWHVHLSTGKPLEAQKVSNSKKRKKKAGLNATKKKKENCSKKMQGKIKTEIKGVINNIEGKIAPGSSPKDCDQNSLKEQATPEAGEVAPRAESKWSLSMLVEKQLGIWQDPEENAENKKNKRSHKRPMSAERRAKKKANERKKRAQKERQLGIVRRRPIVHTPVVKPPTVCKYFMKGRCTKGEACTFSHEVTPETKSELCKFFLNRCCLKGDECPYSHETSSFPCKYFITRGFCKDGEECRFSHKPVSKEEYEKLLKRIESAKKEPLEEDAKAATGGEAKANPESKPEGTAWLGEPDSYSPTRQTEEAVDYDPIPRPASWWNSDVTYSPLEEPAATMAPKSPEYDPMPPKSPKYDPMPPEYDPMPQGCWWNNSGPYSSEADNPLLKAAKQAAAEATAALARPRATPPASSSCAPGSVMDLLQQSLKESGDVFY